MEDIFLVGNDTIDRMNSLSNSSIEDTNSTKMVNVIDGLRRSIERFNKYSNVGYFKKMFVSPIEIEANIKIAHIEFETLLNTGSIVQSNLTTQYSMFGELYAQLKDTYDQFSEDIKTLEFHLELDALSAADKQRIMRKRDDLISAQILTNQAAMQFDLCKSNIGILIDKFISIEKILKPALEQNIKFSKSEFKNIF